MFVPLLVVLAAAPQAYDTPVEVTSEVRYCSGDQPALDLAWPDQPSVALPSLNVTSLTIIDAGMVADAYGNRPYAPCQVGIRLKNAWNASLRRVTCWGVKTCIELRGRSNDVHITELHSYNAAVHVAVLEQSEGTTIEDSRLIGGAIGVFVNTDVGRPGLWITGSHINTTTRGIVVRNHPQGIITGNLLYRLGTGTYVGFEVGPGANDIIIRNNLVHCLSLIGMAYWKTVAGARVAAEAALNSTIACR